MPEFITTNKMKELINGAPPNISKQDFVMGLVQRGHEIEGLNQSFSALDTASNFVPSLVRFGKDIWSAVSNPFQTLDGITKLGQGAVIKIAENFGVEVPEGLEAEANERKAVFDAVVNGLIKERYGSLERAAETIERDPVGFLSDLATVISGSGVILSTVGKVGKGSKVIQVSKTGGFTKFSEPSTLSAKATATGKALTKAGRELEPVGMITKVPVSVAKKFNDATGMSNFLSRRLRKSFVGRKTAEAGAKAIRISGSRADEIAQQTFGENYGIVNAKMGIHGTPEEMVAQLRTVERFAERSIREKLSTVTDPVKSSVTTRRLTRRLLVEIEGGVSPLDRLENLINKNKRDLRQAKRKGEIQTADAQLRVSETQVRILKKEQQLEAMRASEKVSEDQIAVVERELENLLEKERIGIEKIEDSIATRNLREGRILNSIDEMKQSINKIDVGVDSSELLEVTRRLKAIKGREASGALTLSDINELRKIADRLEGGTEVARKDIRRFLEEEGSKAGVTDLRENMAAADYSRQIGDEFRIRANDLANRKSVLDSFIFLGGVAGSGAVGFFVGGFIGAFTVAGVVVGRRLLQSPRFRSAIAAKVYSMSDRDYRLFRQAVVDGKNTRRTRGAMRRMFRELRPLFPEIRLLGKAQQEALDQ